MSDNNRFMFEVTRVERKAHCFTVESASSLDDAESKARDAAANYDFTQHSSNHVEYEADLVSAPNGTKTCTREQKYLLNGGGKCPSCESGDIEGGSLETDGNEVHQGVTCLDCGATWEDRYKLDGVSSPDGFDPEEKVDPAE